MTNWETDIVDPQFRNVGVLNEDGLDFIQCVCEQCQHKIKCAVKYKKQKPIQINVPTIKEAHDACFKYYRVKFILSEF